MEIGEKFIEVVKRKAFAEAGIEREELTLFGIYSGEDGIIIYPNGDICYGIHQCYYGGYCMLHK